MRWSRNLSEDTKVVIALSFAAGMCLALLGILDLPPASWVNELQRRILGFASFKLTAVGLMLLAMIPAGITAVIVKVVSRGPSVDDEEDDHHGPRPKGRREEGYYDAEEGSAPRRRRRREDDEDR
jgi:hypothetical protein